MSGGFNRGRKERGSAKTLVFSFVAPWALIFEGHIICRDFSGVIYDPPLVVNRFGTVKFLCLPHGETGSSGFVGLPSK